MPRFVAFAARVAARISPTSALCGVVYVTWARGVRPWPTARACQTCAALCGRFGNSRPRNIIVRLMAMVSDGLADDAEVVVVEVLSNAVWQSGAANITVEVSVTDELLIEIAGDGRGIPSDDRRRIGLANIA